MFLAGRGVLSRKGTLLTCIGGLCLLLLFLESASVRAGETSERADLAGAVECVGCHASAVGLDSLTFLAATAPCDYCHAIENEPFLIGRDHVEKRLLLFGRDLIDFGVSGHTTVGNRAQYNVAQQAYWMASVLLAGESWQSDQHAVMLASRVISNAQALLTQMEREASSGLWVAVTTQIQSAPVAFVQRQGGSSLSIFKDVVGIRFALQDQGDRIVLFVPVLFLLLVRLLKRHRGPPAVFHINMVLNGLSQRFAFLYAGAISVFCSVHRPIVERINLCHADLS